MNASSLNSGVFKKSWLLMVMMLLSTAFTAAPVYAEDDEPHAILKKVADDMFTALNAHRADIKANPEHTQLLVEKILLPRVDFITASKWVLGKYWNEASKKQKIAFIRQFRTLLLRFYSSALSEYLNSHEGDLDPSIMVFYNTPGSDGDKITVRSEVKPKSGKSVPVNYHMHKTRKGWRVYDVSVEGVSVITTYKTSFANEIKQSGLDALIASLVERNKNLVQAKNDG